MLIEWLRGWHWCRPASVGEVAVRLHVGELQWTCMCNAATNVVFDVAGCMNTKDETDEEHGVWTNHFRWQMPHPENASRPQNCDGGPPQLPTVMYTSRSSCEWIPARWANWIHHRPECFVKFATCTISPCPARAMHTAHYAWRVPNPSNPSRVLMASRCHEEECDYMPYTWPVFLAIELFAGIYITAKCLERLSGIVLGLHRLRGRARRLRHPDSACLHRSA
jgi:hypothetical protein